MAESRILVVKPGQSPEAAEAEEQVKLQRQQMDAARAGQQATLSGVVKVLFMSYAPDHKMAIDVCLEHIAQIAIAGHIERKQLVAWLFERCNLEEAASRKHMEAAKVGLVSGLQAMRAQGLKVPPNIMGQLNLLKVELEPELKEWVEQNQQPSNQLATQENSASAAGRRDSVARCYGFESRPCLAHGSVGYGKAAQAGAPVSQKAQRLETAAHRGPGLTGHF